MTRVKVRGYHEDRFGHVNNARYLEILEEARWDYLEKRGVDAQFLKKQGVFPVVVRLTISYRRPASTGDELLVETRVVSGGRRKVVLAQEARFAGSEELCVEAEVTAVFIDETTGRPAPLTEQWLRAWPELRAAVAAPDRESSSSEGPTATA
ncbi:MAG: thioesterase family protein [Candidatus Bipolaricaulota bacterium]